MLSYPLGIYRGDSYRWRFVLWADTARTVAIDLTSVTVGAEIRVSTGSTPIYPIAIAVTLPNTIDLSLSAAASAQVPAAAIWDLQLTYPSGDVQTIVSGAVSVRGDVTNSTTYAGAMRA
jgi:hypothetical protein